MPPTLTLIDGHALAYRMYFALSSGAAGARWQTSSGEPTAGVFGFARVLLNILENDQPEYLAVAFDTGKTFRDELYPAYKATRAKMPEDLRPQMERIRQLVDAFNIPRLEMEDYEADDILGSVATQAAAQGLGVRIITGDRDLLQLVGSHIIVNLPESGESKDYRTDEEVIARFGVPARLVVDYKALVGDTSDNIPGVKGVGEKTAQSLYQTYASLDEIYAHLPEIAPKTRQKLEENRETAYLSRALAQIHTDLPIRLDLEQAHTQRFDLSKVESLFRELEFKTLLGRLSGLRKTEPAPRQAVGQLSLFGETPAPLRPTPAPVSNLQVSIVQTEAELDALAQTLQKAHVIAFDTETSSTDAMQARLVGISLATEAGKGWYIPLGHVGAQNLPVALVMNRLKESLTSPHIPKIAHNAKYDYIMLARQGLRVAPLAFDTMIAEWLIDAGSRNLGLKNLAFVRLNEEMTRIESLIGSGKSQISMEQVAVEAAAPYAVADAEVCLRLMPLLQADLKRAGLNHLMDEMEMPLISVLAEMEMTGVRLNLTFFEQFGKELTERLKTLEASVFEMVGKSFNLNSTQQLAEVLFSVLGLKPPQGSKKNASGHFSTAAAVLDLLRGQHPAVDLVLEHRELSKLKSTYVDALPAAVDAATGRVHTSYSQTAAVTGRLSSNNPNLQNIPTRTETGRRVRSGFVADSGNLLLSVDYSQVELRIVAHVAGDEAMLQAFREGQDIHATTAAAIYNIPLEKVTGEMRRHAKAINFGLIYGMSSFGLTRSTELTLAESQKFVETYFQRFPGVQRYLAKIRKQAAEQGYVETLLGRKRYFPALQGLLKQQDRQREEREAINAPIQGTAADIMKLAMLKIPSALKAAGLNGKMLLQVHDEVVLECPETELESTARVVQQTMENAYPLQIPLSTEAKFGKNWGAMQPLEIRP